ncbi:MAG: integrase core domain-containing protein, partial [Pirellulaceae bacterium]|nr:integrase core domain-containing protein [Pirellulaceae bacterium]
MANHSDLVGCILRHTAVRDAAAKGKIERFFRRVRDQFLIRNLDLSSIQRLNQQFTDWVERDYNVTVHSTLGMKPIDRFGVDLSRIRFLSPSQDTDELFYAEATRSVKKDNTFSFQGDGVLRRCRNLCLSAMLEAVRASAGRTIDIDVVNRVLL